MSVIHCKEVTNRAGNEDAESLGMDRVRTFQLLCDSATDGVGVVLAYGGLPIFFEPWVSLDAAGVIQDFNLDIICTHRSAEQNDPNDLMNWTVTIRYAGLNPTALPAEVEVDQVDYQTAILDDVVTGESILNSAGEPFESGNLVDRSRGLIRITQNVLEWNAQEMEGYRDTLNDTTMFVAQFPPGFAIGKLKMRSLTAKRIPFPGNQTFYWRATAVIETNLDGWKIKNRDAGYHIKNPVAGQPPVVPILRGGLTPKGIFLLDGFGAMLPDGGTPNIIEANGYEPVDWSGITWLEAW